MEHRWGQRVGVDIPVRVAVHAFSVKSGRISNLSVSGAFIKMDSDVRLLSRVQVVLDLPQRSRHESPTIAAYVARKLKDGIGVEWCEYSPPAITRLVKSMAARRHVRIRTPDASLKPAETHFTGSLLDHGT